MAKSTAERSTAVAALVRAVVVAALHGALHIVPFLLRYCTRHAGAEA